MRYDHKTKNPNPLIGSPVINEKLITTFYLVASSWGATQFFHIRLIWGS
jgi:hypothetical protein